MPRSVTLSVAHPCAENWAAMTPAAQGRHCAACAKTVVDFSWMTDVQVVAYLSRLGSSGCGRFRAEQLNRPLLTAPAGRAAGRWLSAVLALGGLAATVSAVAQTELATPQEQLILLGETTVPVAASPERIIRGRVTDAVTGEGLPGVTVLAKGTTNGRSTDSEGDFELPVPSAPDAQLTFASIGYFTQRMSVRQFTDQQGCVIQLVVDEKAMNEMIIIGGYCAPPWYTPRGLWQRLMRPFRR